MRNSLIPRDAKPIEGEHRSPYKRIDPTHPGRKAIITKQEVVERGGREPDPHIYEFSYLCQCWILKEGFR